MQIANQTIDFRLPELHPKQLDIALSPAKHKRVCAGRRGGKSKLCCSIASLRALAEREPIWWCAPTFRNTKAAWQELTTLARQLGKLVKIYKDDFLIEYPRTKGPNDSAGFVQVVSTAEPDNMRSIGLGGLIYDEAAYGAERAYTEVLQPALLDYADSWDMLITTPNGFNWFYREFKKGQDGVEDYAAFHWTTYDNPFLPGGKKAVDALKHKMTEKAFRQEILAEFVADALSVFRNVAACVHQDALTGPIPGHTYVMGLDWGRKHDYTAVSIWDVEDRREVVLDRFNQVGFGIQRGRVKALAEHWNVSQILAEENGIGMANVEQLQADGLPVTPYKMSWQSKKQLVEALALALEREEVGIVGEQVSEHAKTAIEEMLAYQELVNPQTGVIRYSAPEGGHDDTVIARMLGYHLIGDAIGEPFILDW